MTGKGKMFILKFSKVVWQWVYWARNKSKATRSAQVYIREPAPHYLDEYNMRI